ncbi:MAG: hypothetical protein GEU26_19425 [Nitrososphaeraceae archaeon]|nr:hypothetical protein [Nitrososphaeraceae archaeon]
MARISVVTLPPLDDMSWRYEVEVTESDGSGSQTTHQVTMDKGYYMGLTEKGRIIPEEFVKKSFEFLLERESKDSILRQFEIAQINDFFPEYEKEIKKVVDRS